MGWPNKVRTVDFPLKWSTPKRTSESLRDPQAPFVHGETKKKKNATGRPSPAPGARPPKGSSLPVAEAACPSCTGIFKGSGFCRVICGTKHRRSLFSATLLLMDEIHFAPPKKPWHEESPVNTNKQWFPAVSKWCRSLSIHSMAPDKEMVPPTAD